MEAIELFKLITSQPKWYAGITTAQNAYNIKKKFHAKKLSFAILTKVFNHHGYYLEASWIKK